MLYAVLQGEIHMVIMDDLSRNQGGDAVVPAVYGPTTSSCHCCLRLLRSDRFRTSRSRCRRKRMGLVLVIPTGKAAAGAGAAWWSAGRRPCARARARAVPGLQPAVPCASSAEPSARAGLNSSSCRRRTAPGAPGAGWTASVSRPPTGGGRCFIYRPPLGHGSRRIGNERRDPRAGRCGGGLESPRSGPVGK